MEAIYERAEGQADVPHRHDYYTVLLVEKAKGTHHIDYKQFPFEELEVHFIGPGQVHQVVVVEKPLGRAITFSREFLAVNNIPESFISNINLFKSFGDSPPLKLDRVTFDRLMRIIVEMEACMPLDLKYRTRALGALLQLFLIYCNNSAKLDSTQLDEVNAEVCILRDFKQLVEDNFRQWHKVQEYAAQIHVTPKHLSQTIKHVTGKVAKEHIMDRLLLEAKRLLLHTDMSVKEIAYETGFQEPLHFSGFFKKHAGVSPSKFREEKH